MKVAYSKNYYFGQSFVETWTGARSVCKQYGFDLMSLDTLAEKNNFTAIYTTNKALFSKWVMVGAIETTRSNAATFIWVTTGKPISYPIPWTTSNPDNSGGNEWCLSFDWKQVDVQFNDIACSINPGHFICEQKSVKSSG